VLDELAPNADDAYRKQLVAAATRASRRGAELTAQLLAFSRRQVLQPAGIDVGRMLRALSDMLRRTLDQHIGIEVDVAADCPPVLADQSHLESALLNIAINARDAMARGGTLSFRAARCGVLPPDVRAELDAGAADDGFVAIAIADTGSGMPDEVKERAFEPFFTTKDAGRGTGLGLSTAYGFVKQSTGSIKIDSTPGAGTTVTLYLPRLWDVEESASSVDGEGSQGVPAGLRVLLVEDDNDVSAVVHTFLNKLGCKVSTASSAEQALLALDPTARFDLLLTDIALGAGMRGTELAARAQERFPDLAILLMSGFSSELLDADRDSPPSWELLRKPYSRDVLARAIAQVLGSSSAPVR
jgi:CheY-like chemotaxis protein